MNKLDFVLRSVAKWSVLVAMVAIMGCGQEASQAVKSESVGKAITSEEMAQLAGISVAEVEEGIALQILYEDALKNEILLDSKSVGKSEASDKEKSDCNNGNDKAVGNAKNCSDTPVVTTTTVPSTTTTTVPTPVVTAPVPVPTPSVPVIATKMYMVTSVVPFTKGVPASVQLTMPTGTGKAPFKFSGTLVSGLTLSEGGVISGRPLINGTKFNTVQIIDATGKVFKYTFVYTIALNQPLAKLTLPVFKMGVPVNFQVVPDNTYTATYKFSGITPPGTVISATGLITGTPNWRGSGTVSVSVWTTDSFGNIVFKNFTGVPVLP